MEYRLPKINYKDAALNALKIGAIGSLAIGLCTLSKSKSIHSIALDMLEEAMGVTRKHTESPDLEMTATANGLHITDNSTGETRFINTRSEHGSLCRAKMLSFLGKIIKRSKK